MAEITRDKIVGMFLGGAIGDASFAPVETWSAEKIVREKGFISNYIKPDYDYKFLAGREAGTWTDDTQLTLAVAESLIVCGKIDMDDMARRHVKSYQEEGDFGWGSSTRKAVQNLEKGIHWSKSAIKDPNRGAGNGVLMKISPLAAYYTSRANYARFYQPAEFCICGRCLTNYHFFDDLIKLARMTHSNPLALDSAIGHVGAIGYCLYSEPDRFSVYGFIQEIRDSLDYVHTAKYDNDLLEKLLMLRHLPLKKMTTADFIKLFNGGGCYVADSMPFAYAFFLRNPNNIVSMFNAGNAGGDTDTNASIVGGMLGALNGISIFPQHLIDGLWQKERIIETANKFYDTFFRKEE